MRILITNYAMKLWAGTETVVRDIAIHLRRRGHVPMVYASQVGPFAEQLEAIGIPVQTTLDGFDPPDVIHGHHWTARTAVERFSHAAALFYCHGAQHPGEEPVLSPRILRYLAVDEPCRERVLAAGVSADRVRLLLNFIDLDRFAARSALPAIPRRALVYSNYLTEESGLTVIRRACNDSGIALDAIGVGVGAQWRDPEHHLPEYDIVFAKARAAQEALAVGCAVVLCDAAGLGPMVTLDNFAELRPLNFGFRALTNPISYEGVCARIADYTTSTSVALRRTARAELAHEPAIDTLEAIYRELLVECV